METESCKYFGQTDEKRGVTQSQQPNGGRIANRKKFSTLSKRGAGGLPHRPGRLKVTLAGLECRRRSKRLHRGLTHWGKGKIG